MRRRPSSQSRHAEALSAFRLDCHGCHIRTRYSAGHGNTHRVTHASPLSPGLVHLIPPPVARAYTTLSFIASPTTPHLLSLFIPAAMPAHSASSWPYGVPPAVVRPAKPSDLPPPTLLPSLTRSTSNSTSPYTSKPASRSAYLSHASSYTPSAHSFTTPTPLSRRPSSTPTPSNPAPPLTPGLYHSQRLLSSTSASPSLPLPHTKPRWFTNRLALSLAPTPSSSSHLDFARYQPHQPAPHNPHHRHWTREQMIQEILTQHQRDTAQLRAQRQRLDRKLAQRGQVRGYRGYRGELLGWLQAEDCRIFDGALTVISVQDEELDLLLDAGGCHLIRAAEGVPGKLPAFLVYLNRLNDAGTRCDSYDALVKLLSLSRREAEEGKPQAQPVSPTPAPAEPIVDAEPEPEPELGPEPEQALAVERGEGTGEVEASAGDAEPETERQPEAAQAEEQAAPVVVQVEEAASPVIEAAQEDAASDGDSTFVEPSTSRARMDSVLEGHARHNTVMDDDEAAVAPLNVPALMEKLSELEEEREKEEGGTEEVEPTAELASAPAPASAAAPADPEQSAAEVTVAESKPSEWEDTGDGEEEAL